MTSRRTMLALPGIALLTVVAGGVLWRLWASRLPGDLVVSWRIGGAPGGTLPATTFAVLTLSLAIVLAVGATLGARLLVRHGYGLPRAAAAIATGLATAPVSLLLGILRANLGEYPAAPLWMLVAVAAAGLSAAIAEPVEPEHGGAPGPSTAGLEPGQRAAWLSGARNRLLQCVFLPLAAVPLLPAVATGTPVPSPAIVTSVLVLLVVAVAAGQYTGRVRVTVGAAGVSVGRGPAWGRARHWALDDLASAEALPDPLAVLANGPVLWRPAGSVVGAGPVLVVTPRRGARIVVSAPDAETGAGLLNDLLRHRAAR